MVLSEKTLYSLGRRCVYIFNRWKAKKEIPVKRNGQPLAEEKLTLGFYKHTVFPEMLTDAGFSPLGMTDTEKFFVWQKAK